MNGSRRLIEKKIALSAEQLQNYANFGALSSSSDLPESACCIFNLVTDRYVRTFGKTWIGQAVTGPGGDMGKYRFLISEYCTREGITDKHRQDYAELKLLDEITLFSDWEPGNLIVFKSTHKPSPLCMLALRSFQKHHSNGAVAIIWPEGKLGFGLKDLERYCIPQPA